MDGSKVLYTVLIAFIGYLLIAGITPTVKSKITTDKATSDSALGNASADVAILLIGALPYLYILIMTLVAVVPLFHKVKSG